MFSYEAINLWFDISIKLKNTVFFNQFKKYNSG